jgi:hypothetical protein
VSSGLEQCVTGLSGNEGVPRSDAERSEGAPAEEETGLLQFASEVAQPLTAVRSGETDAERYGTPGAGQQQNGQLGTVGRGALLPTPSQRRHAEEHPRGVVEGFGVRGCRRTPVARQQQCEQELIAADRSPAQPCAKELLAAMVGGGGRRAEIPSGAVAVVPEQSGMPARKGGQRCRIPNVESKLLPEAVEPNLSGCARKQRYGDGSAGGGFPAQVQLASVAEGESRRIPEAPQRHKLHCEPCRADTLCELSAGQRSGSASQP